MSKSIIGEGQMQMDFNPDDSNKPEIIKPEIIPPEVEKESSLTQLFRAHGITEKEFDDYAEKRGCSSYETYRHFGISIEEVVNMGRNYPVGEAVEVIPKDEDGIEKIVGPSILIAKRAIYLTAALERYSKASQVSGLNKALDTAHAGDLYRRYDENALVQMIASRGPRTREGDAEFSKAYGRKEMIEAGEKPSKVGLDERTQTDKFIYSYVGADNPDDRRIYRSVLKKQIKKFKKP